MPADYGGIVAAIATLLKSDAVLTGTSGLLANYGPSGGAASRANSIFYPEPPSDRVFPCITLRDTNIAPGLPRQHDLPMALVRMTLQISVWGRSQDLRPVQTEIDTLLEPATRGGAIDTSQWQFNDIDTSAPWRSVPVPKEMLSGSVAIEGRVKNFIVLAANKTA
ncbi:MAG: hypothetical protein ACREHD_19210 [Pirellulales bacterium]